MNVGNSIPHITRTCIHKQAVLIEDGYYCLSCSEFLGGIMGHEVMQRVILSCGHKRRVESTEKRDGYYCLDCDTSGNSIQEILPDPYGNPANRYGKLTSDGN